MLLVVMMPCLECATNQTRKSHNATAVTSTHMPLFLEAGWYVRVPLEETYQQARRGVPERWRRVIEAD